MFKIDAADYTMSICGSAALRELSSPGKSGSVFYLSQDDRVSPSCSSQGWSIDKVEIDESTTLKGGVVLVAHEPHQDRTMLGLHIRGKPLRASATGHEEVNLLLPGTARLRIQLGVNMPARAERGEQRNEDDNSEGQLFDEVYDVVLYLGIIDILQEYNISKKMQVFREGCSVWSEDSSRNGSLWDPVEMSLMLHGEQAYVECGTSVNGMGDVVAKSNYPKHPLRLILVRQLPRLRADNCELYKAGGGLD
eukprot:Gb_01293 [translate_table: standard]